MSDLEWHLETRHVDSLRGYGKNPRCISKSQKKHLEECIYKFGLIDKPFINLDNTIIGGHQRYNVLRSSGVTEIEVWVPSRMLSGREVEELNYRHNENGGYFDYDMLANRYELADLCAWGDNPLKDEKPEKKVTPKASFEFDSREALDEVAEHLQELAMLWGAKLKVKI